MCLSVPKCASLEACFEYFEKNIEINLILNNKKGLGTSYNNLAFLYEHQGKLEKAQEYYHNSIKIREEINDQDGIVSTLNNLGMLYSRIGDVSKAESCFLESIEKAMPGSSGGSLCVRPGSRG